VIGGLLDNLEGQGWVSQLVWPEFKQRGVRFLEPFGGATRLADGFFFSVGMDSSRFDISDVGRKQRRAVAVQVDQTCCL
jgi:hypothetical protein